MAVVITAWVLGGAAAPAIAASAGPERTVATGQNPNDSVDTAFDGTNSLVVWTRGAGPFADVVGARVAPDGTVLDPVPIAISVGVDTEQSAPAVGFDGTRYLVVWKETRGGTADIYGARVSTAGVVLDPVGVPFSTAPGHQYGPSVGFTGSLGFVAWQDDRSGSGLDIYGTRWTSLGGVRDPSGSLVSDATGHQYAPSVAAVGGNFLVAWTDERNASSKTDVYASRVSLEGVARDPAGIPISTGTDNQSAPDVAFDGTRALIVWSDRRSGTNDIYATRWTAADGVVDPTGIPVSTAPQGQFAPEVAFKGSFLVVWSDDRNRSTASDLYASRVTTEGAVSDPNGVVVSTGAASELLLGASPAGDGWGVAYSRTDGGVYFRTVSSK